MAINEKIITGKKMRRFVDGAWERMSFWHKASDCEFDDGMTAQEKLGDIKGITASTNVKNTGYAADAKVVSNIYQNLTVDDKQFVFDYQDGKFGYNTDPKRSADSFNPFNIAENYNDFNFKYNNELALGFKMEPNINCVVQIKLKIDDIVSDEDKIFLNFVINVPKANGFIIDNANMWYVKINETTKNYQTFYNNSTNIFTINFSVPGFIKSDYIRNSCTIAKVFTNWYEEDEGTHYNAQILEASLLYNDNLNTNIQCNGTIKIECSPNFKFDIKDNFKLSNKQLFHNGLTTSSTGSNLIISDGNFYKKSSSSQRYKNSIEKLSTKVTSAPILNPHKLYNLNVVSFRYNDDYLPQTDQRFNTDIPGFIAEEVYEKYPIACNLDNNGQPEMWDINIMFPAALKLIQEQHEDIEKLKENIALISNK